MRIRSIRPEFWSSQDVAALDWNSRLVFIGLWSYVDDNGVGRDVERLIVADLFPLDESLSEASRRVHGALKRLETGGQITRYVVDGKPYLFINAFAEHQVINRPSKGRYPPPTSENAKPHDTLTEDSVSTPANAPLGEGEKGRRGEVTTSAPRGAGYSEDFLKFWELYPSKKDKADAYKAWQKALRRAPADKLIAAVQAYPFRPDPQYIKHAATWLNKGSWEDVDEAPLLPMYDVNKLPEPGTGWSPEQLDMVLGSDPWTPPEPPAELDEDGAHMWLQQERRRHFAERVQNALRAIGRTA